MPSGSVRAYTLRPDEHELLRQFERDEGILFIHRPRLDEDPARLLAIHAQAGCAWIREGRPRVTVPGRHPEDRLRGARP